MALPPSSPEARDAALTMAGIVVVAGAAVGADEAVGAGVALRAGVRYVGEKIAGAVVRQAAKDNFTGKGGVKGANKEFGRASGKEIDTGKQGVRVKLRSNGERVEMHDSTGKNPSVPRGTRTIKVQDQNGKVIKTTRYPEPKPPKEVQ